MMKKPSSFDEAILNTTKARQNKYGDSAQRDLLYQPWEKTYAKTIGEFYSDFIEPRLPDPEVVKEWHDVIKYYAAQKNVVFPVRAGNMKSMLRRGWLVEVNADFSYMFTDNDMAVYIYKMALDGFCPDKDVFVKYMTEFVDIHDIGWLKTDASVIHSVDECTGVKRKFLRMPVHFNRAGGSGIDATETKKNAYINTSPAPSCCLGKYNYKHAHIIDVADKDYKLEDCPDMIKWEEKKKTLLGDVDDYKWDSVKSNYVWKRSVSSVESDELKKLLTAHLFRFLDPLNHFLTPMENQNRYTRTDGVRSVDIAEYENLQKYVIDKKRCILPSEFDEFILLTCPPDEWRSTGFSVDDNEEIDVVYHEKTLSSAVYGKTLNKNYKVSIKTPKPLKSPKSKKTSGGKITRKLDDSKYDLNGKTYKKNGLVLAIVEDFLNRNPDSTFVDLTTVFALKFSFGKKPWIRKPSDLTAKEIEDERAHLKNPLTLVDGTVVVVNNQVVKDDMPEILRIAKSAGCIITKI